MSHNENTATETLGMKQCKRCGVRKLLAEFYKNLNWKDKHSYFCKDCEKARNKSRPRSYGIWVGMRARCRNPRNVSYQKYGERGISFCERWESYQNFIADMGEPKADESLDRIDNDGNYEPSNCRWADCKTQANNTSKTVRIEWQGQIRTTAEWAAELGLPRGLIKDRLRRQWPIEAALTTPAANHKHHCRKNI